MGAMRSGGTALDPMFIGWSVMQSSSVESCIHLPLLGPERCMISAGPGRLALGYWSGKHRRCGFYLEDEADVYMRLRSSNGYKSASQLPFNDNKVFLLVHGVPDIVRVCRRFCIAVTFHLRIASLSFFPLLHTPS